MFAILQDYEAPDEVVQIIAQHAYRRGAGTVSQGKLIRESAGIMGIIDITPVQRTESLPERGAAENRDLAVIEYDPFDGDRAETPA
jgi:hypothetical protein